MIYPLIKKGSCIAYIGCYADVSYEDLPYNFSGSGITVQSCVQTCQSYGYTYAGLQNGY